MAAWRSVGEFGWRGILIDREMDRISERGLETLTLVVLVIGKSRLSAGPAADGETKTRALYVMN